MTVQVTENKPHRILDEKRILKELGLPVGVEAYQIAQVTINFENGRVLYSYNSLVAVVLKGNIYLTAKHDYSRTTSKYVTKFTGLTSEERRKWLSDGTILLIQDYDDTN